MAHTYWSTRRAVAATAHQCRAYWNWTSRHLGRGWGSSGGRVQSSSLLSSICPPPRLLPYLEHQLGMSARRLTVEDTVAAYWYCLRRGVLASAPATTAANLKSNLREPFAPAMALLEGGPAWPPALRRTAHLDLTTEGPLDARLYRLARSGRRCHAGPGGERRATRRRRHGRLVRQSRGRP